LSYDVEIASSRKPDLTALILQLRALQGVISANHTGSQVELNVQSLASEPTPVFVDEAEHVETDEFDDQILAYCRSPRWRTNICAPMATGGAGADVARAAAIVIAKKTGGVAFDPQVDGVLWPEKKLLVRLPQAPRAEQEIDLIELQWIAPLPKGTVVQSNINPEHVEAGAELCCTFLKSIATALPSCLLKKVSGSRGKGPIAIDVEEHWRAISGRHYGGLIHFSGKWPCLGGYIKASVGNPSMGKRTSAVDCVVFQLSVEAKAFERGALAAELRKGFVEIGHALDAMFGVGYRLRGHIWARSQLWSRMETEQSPILVGLGWDGIPPGAYPRIWLHRFYADNVRSKPPASIATSRGLGMYASLNEVGEAKLNLSSLVLNEYAITPGQMLATGYECAPQPAKNIPLYEILREARGG